MALIPAKCAQCGADLQIDDTRNVYYCNFCGAKMIFDKQYVEHSGSVSLSGMASEDSLMERAYMFIEDGEFSKADDYFERVLDANPKSWKAYLGKLLCLLYLKNPNHLSLSETPLTDYPLYNKAVKFAPPREKEILLSYNEVIVKKIKEEEEKKRIKIQNMQDNLDILIEKANILDEYIDTNSAKYVASSTTKTLLLVGVIVCIFFMLVFFVVFVGLISEHNVGAAILALIATSIVISAGVGCYILNEKLRKFTKAYLAAKKDLEKTDREIAKIEAYLERESK